MEQKNQGRRAQDQTNPDNGQKGKNGHEHPPQYRGADSKNGKGHAPEQTLDQAADPVTNENSPADLFKFNQQPPIMVIGQGRKSFKIGNEPVPINEQKENNQKHHHRTDNKMKQVSRPGTGLIIDKHGCQPTKISKLLTELPDLQANPITFQQALHLNKDNIRLENLGETGGQINPFGQLKEGIGLC